MIKTDFSGIQLPLLGLGTMRFPLRQGSTDPADVDIDKTREIIKAAMAGGVNYFDTAYPYHGSISETLLGEILSEFPRDSYLLATKFPGHQILSEYDPSAIFEEQLRKCKVEYFDFYLLHNVYENSYSTYTDERWGIIDYFLKMKREGKIRYLGFSTHGGVRFLEDFLLEYGKIMDFCQIQLNYVDWSLQDAKTKCELLKNHKIPVFVMEPVRGGKLSQLPAEDMAVLSSYRPEWSSSEWAFRWLQGIDNIKVILSGMSSMDQLLENINTFSERATLSVAENEALYRIADKMKTTVPCTSCRYCTDNCPMGIDIPEMLSSYNEICFSPSFNIGMRMDAVPVGKRAVDCIECGQCVRMCPQRIDIPKALKDFGVRLEGLPKWADICRERELAAKRNK